MKVASALLCIPGKRPQFFRVTSNVGNHAVTFLRSAAVTIGFGPGENVGLEFSRSSTAKDGNCENDRCENRQNDDDPSDRFGVG